MRLPSSYSLILASLVVSSSSLLSALAAPVGCDLEDSSSPAPAAVLPALQHTLIPPSGDDTMPQPNSHLQTSNFVDNSLLKRLVSAGGAEGADEAGDHGASEDPSMQPSTVAGHGTGPGFPSQPLLSRGHAGRQVIASPGNGEGGRKAPSPPDPTPLPPR